MHALSRFYHVLVKALTLAKGRRLSLEEGAVELEVIHPAEVRPLSPVEMLEEDKALVTDAMHPGRLGKEWRSVNGEAVRHEATIRYTFRNVLATLRGFYTSAGPFQTGGSYFLSGLITAKIPVYETGFYSPPTIGRRFFAHWMLDGLAHTLLRLPDEALYFGTPQNWPHACEYLDILGLDRIKSPFVYFKEMTYCEDIGQNAGRHARFAEMRRRLFAKIGAETHRGVFIKRGETGVRRLLDNEKDLEKQLVARGYRVCSATDDLNAILAATAGASVVVSMEGSHWAHAYHAARWGARHVIINPSDRFNCWISDITDAVGARMGNVVATPQGDGYSVDIAKTMRMVDWAEAEADQSSEQPYAL